MTPPHHWTPDEDEAIRDGAEEGSTFPQVAAELGVSRRLVMRRACKLGIRFPRGKSRSIDLRATLMRIVETQGPISGAAVARLMGRSKSLVSRWVSELVNGGALDRTGRGKRIRLSVALAWMDGRKER